VCCDVVVYDGHVGRGRCRFSVYPILILFFLGRFAIVATQKHYLSFSKGLDSELRHRWHGAFVLFYIHSCDDSRVHQGIHETGSSIVLDMGVLVNERVNFIFIRFYTCLP